jgi:phosphoribosyl-ATP pyrophosphohydrolase
MFTWKLSLKKIVPVTILHETSDLIYAIEVLLVEITLMLKAVKSYHYNKKKKHCNIRIYVI